MTFFFQERALADLIVSLCLLGRFPEAEQRTKAALVEAKSRDNSKEDVEKLSLLLKKMYLFFFFLLFSIYIFL